MAENLELSDQKFKITMINMLRAVKESRQHAKPERYQNNGSSKNQKEMLEIKDTVTETKNRADELISRLDTAKESINKYATEGASVETSKLER